MCVEIIQVGQIVNPSTPPVTLLGKQNTQHFSVTGYTAMAVHNAGSHPVNIFRAEKHNSGANTQLFSLLISLGQYPAFLKAGLSVTHSFLLNLLNSGDFTSQI